MSRFVAAAAVVALAYLFPYFYLGGEWWRFAVATVVIFGTGAVAFGPEAWRILGLALSTRDLLKSISLFALALPLSWLVLDHVVLDGSIIANQTLDPRWLLGQFSQVLNDEMVVRAALLGFLLRAFPHPKTAILSLSLVFSLSHRLAYGSDGVEIGVVALLTLFAFGVIANTLFVRFQHIGYGVALHYAWNFWRFNYDYYLDGARLPEGATFNFIEGNAWVAVGSTLIMLLVFGAYVRSARSRSFAPGA